ncbi:MAG: ABC transporter ATP-binding protein [Spirochaetaceae bacterium]|jgi:simple sugar transport system ATP-binding protein|nr:ABC transporter ATP-binding protein [Spirochaetaceae bacterium]
MEHVLELKGLTKIYPGGVLANHNISFTVREGEIHAVVGENGAGKSTLMKMLFGMESITSGQIFLRGEEMQFNSSRDAIAQGLGMVHQHFMLVDSFTGSENLVLGLRKGGFFTNARRENALTRDLAKKYGFEIEASRRIRDMSVGMKQKLEILKILYRGARIIILDEPTAVLTPQEMEELFDRLLALKEQGMTIIFISHKLGEVKRLSDRLTILKGGRTMGTFNTADISIEEISNRMVGRVISFKYDKPPAAPTRELLEVADLRYKDKFGVMKLNGVSLKVRDSEIVGIAGVEGNGQSELVGIITANIRAQAGTVRYKGRDITNASIGEVRAAGVSYVPEDRMFNGCAAPMSIQENLVASNIDTFARKNRIIDLKKAREHSRELIRKFSVKAPSENTAINNLSGGNIQKVIVAREFSAGSSLLVLDQPTRGIDVGAISFIHGKILEMRRAGSGILLVSADLNELIALSDRILVMFKGEVVAELDNTVPVDEKEVGLYMLGLKRQREPEKGVV